VTPKFITIVDQLELVVGVSGPGTANRMYIYTGTAVIDFAGLTDDWTRDSLQFDVSTRLFSSIQINRIVAIAAPSSYSNTKPNPSVGWAVDNATAGLDATTQRIQLTTKLAVRGRDGQLLRVAYQVTVLASVQLQAGLLKVNTVRVLAVPSTNPTTVTPAVLYAALGPGPLPSHPVPLQAERNPNCLEVQFVNAILDGNSVIPGTSVTLATPGGAATSGVQMSSDTWRFGITGFLPILGLCTFTVRGDGPTPVRAQGGTSLDGDPLQLPSGDDVAGGDFVFKLDSEFG